MIDPNSNMVKKINIAAMVSCGIDAVVECDLLELVGAEYPTYFRDTLRSRVEGVIREEAGRNVVIFDVDIESDIDGPIKKNVEDMIAVRAWTGKLDEYCEK